MAGTTKNAYDRVAREDAILFINACVSSTGQKEFYENARSQGLTLGFLHEYLLGNYRSLYARCLAAGINHFNQGLIIVNLLAHGKGLARDLARHEMTLMLAALRLMPPQRALKVLMRLVDQRINNRRARALIKDYIAARPDQCFDAVKYRRQIKALAAHAHLRLNDERCEFLFAPRQRSYKTGIFETYRRAHYAKEAVFQLPFTIAEGLAGRHGIGRAEFLARIADRMTPGEKLRVQRLAARTGPGAQTAVAVEFSRFPLTRLAIFLLALSDQERMAKRGELEAAFETSARRIIRRHPFQLPRTAAILDCSYSMSGSTEKRNRPLALCIALDHLLRLAATDYLPIWSPTVQDPLFVNAKGQSDLAGPFIKALQWGAEQIIVLSDGCENDPPHGFATLMRIYREQLDPRRKVSVIHLNPVFDAANFAPRRISALVPTVGIRDIEDFFALISFARFSEGKASLAQLERYLDTRVAEMKDLADQSLAAARARSVDAGQPEKGYAGAVRGCGSGLDKT